MNENNCDKIRVRTFGCALRGNATLGSIWKSKKKIVLDILKQTSLRKKKNIYFILLSINKN